LNIEIDVHPENRAIEREQAFPSLDYMKTQVAVCSHFNHLMLQVETFRDNWVDRQVENRVTYIESDTEWPV